MTKKDRFNEAFKYLRSKGTIHTQKDVADKMESSASNISRALKGVESVMTDRFLMRFGDTFGISIEWLLTGCGEMLTANVGS